MRTITVSVQKLIIALSLVFLLGIGFALVNGWYVQEQGEPLPLLIYGLSFLSLIVGALVVLLFQWKIQEHHLAKVLKILPREERIVVQLLLQNNYQLEQNKLVALSGFTKVKISRILKTLEQREVIKKLPLGNTNLVILKL